MDRFGHRRLRLVLLGVTVLVVGGLVVGGLVALGLTVGWGPAAAVAGLLAVIGVIALADGVARGRRRRVAFAETYGGSSLDAARARLGPDDVAAVRRLREEQGTVQAVRHVMRVVPHLTVQQAADVVRDA